MELTQGKMSNYTGQVNLLFNPQRKDPKQWLQELHLYLASVDKDLINLWNLAHFIAPMIGSAKSTLATNSSIGFSYIPTMNSNPTGTPTAYTGKVAVVYCTSNSSLYIYNTSNSSWTVEALT